MKKMLTFGVSVACAVLLVGCSTSSEKLLTDGDSTMREIWDGSTGNSDSLQQIRSQNGRMLDPVDYISSQEQRSYTRTAENEVNNLFPKLPNPDLTIYVYPHLTSSGEPVPVPGYTTVIPFYSRVQYAQPGERTKGL